MTYLLQSLAVMKLVVDRLDFPSEDLLGSSDLIQTLLSLAKFIDRYNVNSSPRIKVQLCAFCDSVLMRSDDLGIRKDDTARNGLLDIIVEWIQSEVRHFYSSVALA